MSSAVLPIVAYDSRMKDSESMNYLVYKSGKNITYQKQLSSNTTATTSTVNVECNVPSPEQTRISTKFTAYCELTYELTAVVPQLAGGVAIPTLVNFGGSASRELNNNVNTNAFPYAYVVPRNFMFQQHVQNTVATINTDQISENTSLLLNEKLRMIPSDDLYKYNAHTPVQNDVYYNYVDDVPLNNGIYRGPSFDMEGKSSRASYRIKSMTIVDGAGAVATNSMTAGQRQGVDVNARTRKYTVVYETYEPILMSPFSFRDGDDGCFSGINKLNFSFTFHNTPRGICSATSSQLASWTSKWNGVSNLQIQTIFLTPPETISTPPVSVRPYLQFSTYTTPTRAVGANAVNQTVTCNATITKTQSDGLLIFIRETPSQKDDSADRKPTRYLSINNLNLTYQNVPGLLTQLNQKDLWAISSRNGINMSFEEFSGSVPNGSFNGNDQSSIPTVGSLIYLRFAKDIPLNDITNAPGCRGNFTLQLQINFSNQSSIAYNAGDLEAVIVHVDSGFFVAQNYTAQRMIGVLSPEVVVSSINEQEGYREDELQRLVGGSVWGDIKSGVKWLLPKLPGLLKHGLRSINHPYAQKGADVLQALGAGAPVGDGSGMSAAGMSGAGRKKRYS
jgi:hypothetical protein